MASACLGAVAACDPAGGGLVTESVDAIPAFYYRVTADYVVKATGEDISFDFVVVCGGEITRWRSGSPSVAVSWYPNFMAMPTEDGAAIGLRVPQLCESWAWGEDPRTGEPDPRYAANPPDDFLPATIWYPDVNYLGFGIGYESDVAYESAYSKLEFKGASLAKSNQAEWEAWRKRSADGYETVGGIPGPWGYSLYGEDREYQLEIMGRNRGVGIAGDWCFSAVRVPMSSDMASDLAALAPADASRYWAVPMPYDTFFSIAKKYEPFEGDTLNNLRHNLDLELGVRRSGGELHESMGQAWRGGGRLVNPKRNGNFYHDMFPVFVSEDQPENSDQAAETTNLVHLMLSEEWEGFSTCGKADFSRAELEAYSKGQSESLRVTNADICTEDRCRYDVYANDHLLVGDLRMAEVINIQPKHIVEDDDYFYECCSRR